MRGGAGWSGGGGGGFGGNIKGGRGGWGAGEVGQDGVGRAPSGLGWRWCGDRRALPDIPSRPRGDLQMPGRWHGRRRGRVACGQNESEKEKGSGRWLRSWGWVWQVGIWTGWHFDPLLAQLKYYCQVRIKLNHKSVLNCVITYVLFTFPVFSVNWHIERCLYFRFARCGVFIVFSSQCCRAS